MRYKTPFLILLRAHDSVWRDPGFTLKERIAAVNVIWGPVTRGEIAIPGEEDESDRETLARLWARDGDFQP